MDFIKEWAISLCVAFIISAILGFIVPDGNVKKIADVVISMFLMAVIIVPLKSEKMHSFDIKDSEIYEIPDEENYIAEYNEFIMNSSKRLIEDELTNILTEVCLDKFYVEINVENSDAGAVALNEVVIRVSSADFMISEKIKSNVSQKFGIVPIVELIE